MQGSDDQTNVTLSAVDGAEYTVDVEVAKISETIKNLIEDAGIDNPVPLPNITGPILAKVIEFCKYYHEHPPAVAEPGAEPNPVTTSAISTWEAEYVRVDQQLLFQLVLAANYLDIKPLLDLTCKTIANMIKGKTPDEIRKTFNIKNDFTPEEEEAIRKENEWCEEKPN